MANVVIGQVWRDNDKRTLGRYLRIRSIVDGFAVCVRCDKDGLSRSTETRLTQIRLDRFRPTSTGYVLEKDVPPAPVSP